MREEATRGPGSPQGMPQGGQGLKGQQDPVMTGGHEGFVAPAVARTPWRSAKQCVGGSLGPGLGRVLKLKATE